jgi:hypothetical protein
MDGYNVQTAPRYTREEAVERLLGASDGWLTRSSAECLLQRGLSEVGDDGKYTYTKDVRVKVLETNPVAEDGTLVQMSSSCKCHVLVINASQGRYTPLIIFSNGCCQHNMKQKQLISIAGLVL